jgi:hypothetical protein
MNKTHSRALLTALLCGGLLAIGTAAQADDDRRGHRGHGWKHHKHHHYHDHHYRGDRHTVIRERVIVRERPRYYDEREVHHHYYTPPRAYSRSPAVVIGVDIPPLVIPLR